MMADALRDQFGDSGPIHPTECHKIGMIILRFDLFDLSEKKNNSDDSAAKIFRRLISADGSDCLLFCPQA